MGPYGRMGLALGWWGGAQGGWLWGHWDKLGCTWGGRKTQVKRPAVWMLQTKAKLLRIGFCFLHQGDLVQATEESEHFFFFLPPSNAGVGREGL